MTLLEHFIEFLFNVGEGVEIIPFLAWLYIKYAYKKDKFSYSIDWIVLYCSVKFIFNVLSHVVLYWVNNNLLLYAILGTTEMLFILNYYLRETNTKQKAVIMLNLMMFTINVVMISLHDPLEFNTLLYVFNILVLIILSGKYLFVVYDRADTVKSNGVFDSGFLINAGILLYLSGSFFVYLMLWEIARLPAVTVYANAYFIIYLVSIIKIAFITAALFKAK